MLCGAQKTRLARADDLFEIERIENAVFDGDRLSRRSLRRLLVSPASLMLALTAQGKDGETVAGYSLMGFRKRSSKARLYSIALDPAAQARGLGRFLLGASERAARARGALLLRLEVRADNARAIALYENAGYVAFGRHEDYYEDGASAIRFEKPLAG